MNPLARIVRPSPILYLPRHISRRYQDANLHTGGSAAAAADLVHQLKGQVIGYLFILEIPGLNGREKLSAPTTILIENP